MPTVASLAVWVIMAVVILVAVLVTVAIVVKVLVYAGVVVDMTVILLLIDAWVDVVVELLSNVVTGGVVIL